MRPIVMAVALHAVVAWCGSSPAADQGRGALQAWCVVTNHAVNRAISSDYRGGKIYFCSEECRKKFLSAPDRYAVRANYQLAATGQARQVACPFTGQALNPRIAPMEVGGLSVAFCCRQCQQTVATADYQTRIELVFGDAFRRGYVVNRR